MGEFLPAEEARVWFVALVCAFVFREVAGNRERFVTNVACVGFRIRVNPSVSVELGESTVRVVAYVTYEWLQITVVQVEFGTSTGRLTMFVAFLQFLEILYVCTVQRS